MGRNIPSPRRNRQSQRRRVSDEPTNADRRERARNALRQYTESKGEIYEENSSKSQTSSPIFCN
jgi:hypothetical protein